MIKYWSLYVLFVVFLRSQNGIFFFYISVISAYKQAEFAENVNSKVSIWMQVSMHLWLITSGDVMETPH